jgi:DNA repair protein RecO (recombination protein O)
MEGIVINTIDYKEKSKIVYLYTPNGINSVKALDVMKKNLGFTVTLNHVEYSISNSKFPTVLEYSLKKSYFDLCTNLSKINIINIMIDIIKKLEGDYPHSRIFNFFKECLDLLEESNEPRFVLSLFLIKMLYIFGVKPTFDECVLCGNKTLVNFSSHTGGALCNKCSNMNEDGIKHLNWFKKIYQTKEYNEELFDDIDYKELLNEISTYYLVHVNIKLKQMF